MSTTTEQREVPTLKGLGIDPFDPATIASPHATFKRLRDEAPLVWSEFTNSWMLSRYEDVRRVLRAHDDFTSTVAITAGFAGPEGLTLEQVPPPGAFSMHNSDRPDHTRLRGCISRDFAPPRIRALRARIDEIITEILDGAAERESFDAAFELADMLPVRVIAELMGIPTELGRQFKIWTDTALAPVPPDWTVEQVKSRNATVLEFRQFLQDQIDDRRRNPKEDFIGRLVTAQEEGGKLSDPEILAGVNILLLAGNETTTNLIGSSILNLCRQPERQDELIAHPDLLPAAVEELTRFDGPVTMTLRGCNETTDFHGHTLEPGEIVTVLLTAANRDERQFANPDALDFHRERVEHLGFGVGIHGCLGRILALLETQAALEGLFKEFGAFELAVPESKVRYRPNFVMRGPNYLPIRRRA